MWDNIDAAHAEKRTKLGAKLHAGYDANTEYKIMADMYSALPFASGGIMGLALLIQYLDDFQNRLHEMQNGQTDINEAQNRLQSLDADLKQEAMKRIGAVDAELSEVNKSIGKVEGAATRTTVRSPVHGIVKGLTIHTLGAVIEPGKVLMEIVPLQEELVVEAMVSPTDIGNVRKDQAVKLKVSAFDFSRYGSIQGKVEDISASTFQTEENKSFYKVRVKLDQNFVGQDPSRNLVVPGMTVQADIVTGNKTVMDYLLKPIHVVATGAFHEH